MEEIRKQIIAITDAVHRLDKDQAVLAANVVTMSNNITAMTTNVTALTAVLNQQQGAMNFAKWVWGCLGALGGGLATYLKISHQ